MTETINQKLIKDDLYQAVNGTWLKTAQIPADKSSTGGFADLAENIEKLLMKDFDRLAQNPQEITDPYLLEFIKFYRLAHDFAKRDAVGFKAARHYLETVAQIKDLTDWEQKLAALTLSGYPSPIPLYVEPDMKNTSRYALTAGVPNLILPDKTYYTDDNPAAQALLQVYTKMLEKLFKLAGYSAEFTQKTIAQTLAFDKTLVPHVKDSTELADYVKSYNKYSFADFVKSSDHFDIQHFVTELLDAQPDQVIVTQPKYYAALNSLVTPETFANMRGWMLAKSLLAVSPYLSDQARIISGEYSRAISGSKEPMNPQKSAYYLAINQFDQIVGLYYAHKYFGEQAKNDVTQMVHKMVTVYKKRLQQNKWLSQPTREKAVVKLEKLGIQVGYPDKLEEIYKKFKVTSDSLFNNSVNFDKIYLKDHYSRWNKEVDREKWEMSADTVNAYYNPSQFIKVGPIVIKSM